jgi:multidrug efflux pump subunit AcrA (membrane-fusion protein)
LQLKKVTVSRYSEQDVYISSGLADGDRVVVAGVGKLRPGLVVRLLEEPKL